MTGSRADFTCTAFGGSIYAIGGYLSTNSAVYLNSIERYDPATDTWTALTGTISARYALGSAEVGGLIYIFGGYDGTQEGFTEFYNPGTDTVSALTGFATPLSDIKGAGDGVDGIWTFGGKSTGPPVNTAQRYSVPSDNWTSFTGMPTTRWRDNSVALGGYFYVIGGFDAATVALTTNERYDPVADNWATMVPMPTARAFVGTAVVNGHIYVLGGSAAGTENEVYTP
jgi:N-acetylneuraminic acid mutarotase